MEAPSNNFDDQFYSIVAGLDSTESVEDGESDVYSSADAKFNNEMKTEQNCLNCSFFNDTIVSNGVREDILISVIVSRYLLDIDTGGTIWPIDDVDGGSLIEYLDGIIDSNRFDPDIQRSTPIIINPNLIDLYGPRVESQNRQYLYIPDYAEDEEDPLVEYADLLGKIRAGECINPVLVINDKEVLSSFLLKLMDSIDTCMSEIMYDIRQGCPSGPTRLMTDNYSLHLCQHAEYLEELEDLGPGEVGHLQGWITKNDD